MLIKHSRRVTVNVKDFGSTARRTENLTAVQTQPHPPLAPPMQSPTRLHALKVAYADALWTLTPTAQLPFTENAAPPFWIIKNIIFLPANFLC